MRTVRNARRTYGIPDAERELQRAKRSATVARRFCAEGDYDAAVQRAFFAVMYAARARCAACDERLASEAQVDNAFSRQDAEAAIRHAQDFLRAAMPSVQTANK